mgnify:FL=1
MDDSNERYVRKLDQAGVADRGEAKTPTEAEADADQLPPVSRAAPPSAPPSVRPAGPSDCERTRRSDIGFCDGHFHLESNLADGGQPKSKPCPRGPLAGRQR